MRVISGNAGIGSVSLTYTDGTPKTVATDIYGNYFLMVSNHWSGTIAPIKDGGYTFTPREYTDVQSDLYNQDYTPLLNGPEISIKGNNININDGDSTPSTTDHTNFSSTPVAGGSVSRIFTIYNTGAGDLNLTDSLKVTISGAHASDFSVTVQPSSPIAPSDSTPFTVVFDPSAGGVRTASISIANDDLTENPYNFSIQGTGATFPEIDIQGNNVSILDGDTSPSLTDHTDFGTVSTASAPFSRTFTIYNVGDGDLTLIDSKIIVSGTNSSDFTVVTQPSTPIIPGGSTAFTISFSPTGSGLRTASLSIYSTDSNENPYNFSVQGMAIVPEMSVYGNGIVISDGDSVPSTTDHTNFGSTPVADGSVSRTFTIYNTGNGDLNFGDSPKVVVSGTHASDFSITAQPMSPIAPSGSTTFTVVFDPSAGGVRTASISITNDDPNENPYNFSIQGTGATFPEIEIWGNNVSILDGDTTPSLTDHTDFGSTPLTGGTVSRTFTIYNIGDGSLTLTGSPSKVLVTGTNSSDFTVALQPTSPITPGGSTTFIITFDPAGSGLRTASLSVYSNDSDENPYNFSIQGTGTTPEIDIQGNNVSIPDGDTTPSLTDHTDFGSTLLAGGTVSRTFTIYNIGDGDLTLTGSPARVSISGPNADNFTVTMQPSGSITPNGLTTFTVFFTPSMEGLHIASISISNNDSNENPFNFLIQGVGKGEDPRVLSIIRTDNNPTAALNVKYTVTFSEPVTGVDATDFGVMTSGGSDAFVTAVSGSDATYTVSVNTGSGDGPLRLDVLDDDTIQDSIGNALAGGFTNGESYTIDKTAPTVVSSVRANTNPTSAANVDFTVTFSESVTGVDATDFSVMTSEGSDAFVSAVSGSGTTYTISVNTGSASAALRLDVLDDDTITDLAGNTQSGDFASGESYTFDNTVPSVVSSVRAEADPTSAASVDFTVTFSEPVTGVNATDFSLSVTGVTGASISAVSGSGTTYTVSADTDSGNGTIRLDVLDDDTILDSASNSLAGGFTSGETYTLDHTLPTVNTFTATSPSTSLDIPITAFAASDNDSVAGYLITESATPPSAGAADWTGSAPTTYTVGSSGIYTLYPWAKDAAGNVSAVYGSPVNVTVTTTLTFKSTAAQDGWILESSETSGNGGTTNATASTLNLGDDSAKRQYRSILSFTTSSLPDNAVIIKVTLKLKRQGIIGGGNPVSMFQGFVTDVKKGTFGTAPLALADFKVNANKTVGPQSPALTSGWYSLNLAPAKAYVNKLATNSGLTQIRLRFKLDDNNNATANFLKLYSGNAGAANRPQLIIEYYIP